MADNIYLGLFDSELDNEHLEAHPVYKIVSSGINFSVNDNELVLSDMSGTLVIDTDLLITTLDGEIVSNGAVFSSDQNFSNFYLSPGTNSIVCTYLADSSDLSAGDSVSDSVLSFKIKPRWRTI